MNYTIIHRRDWVSYSEADEHIPMGQALSQDREVQL